MARGSNKDIDPHYVAQRLRQQYGDGALKALHAMTFSKERRGAAQRKKLFDAVSAILLKGQGGPAGGVVDISA